MIRFTDTYIKNLRPKEKRDEKYEGGGFGIFIYPTGSKTWIYRYKIDNKKDYIIIGHYPAMSLSEAKKKFLDLKEIRRNGINPKEVMQKEEEEAQKEQQKYTVKDLFLNWYSNYIERHRKQPGQVKQHIQADIIPSLGERDVTTIQARDITMELDKIVQRGAPVHANKVLSTIKQAFSYAVSRGELMINPAANIRARDIGGLEKPRDRYLTLEEVKSLWLFLDSDKNEISLQVKNALKIILLTGVRTGELRVATWQEFDFDNSLWTIPSNHTKTGLVMRVHLTGLVKSLLLELKSCSMGDCVISGADGLSPLTDKAMPRAVIRIQERVGIPQWTAHDLRRTFATQLGETLNIDPVVIEKCLGHKMPKIMATYNKNEMLPQRKEALEKWSTLIINLVSL
ncbi:tyrosine-type recombinase/integrase [Legionella spiritensis]|uniref:tyrosine-type recombinase/integrase n=1 Tax=Legionella spiritensis TaxID=452 RepID=UPI000F6B485B|nr:site-specific integrase [Legionella spiritensis]VEG91159.1 phage-related integrase [Legionella spiritensis]